MLRSGKRLPSFEIPCVPVKDHILARCVMFLCLFVFYYMGKTKHFDYKFQFCLDFRIIIVALSLSVRKQKLKYYTKLVLLYGGEFWNVNEQISKSLETMDVVSQTNRDWLTMITWERLIKLELYTQQKEKRQCSLVV